MADLIVRVLDPADQVAFLTLREAKLLLGLPPTGADPIDDERLQLQINIASATIMRLCNRVMAYERIAETWRNFNPVRTLFLSHFPVNEDDVEEVIGGGGPLAFELEEQSGTLHGNFGGGDVRIVYSGGFELPDEAPLDLKQACLLMLSSQRSAATRESIEGIRMIAHKDSRVLFFDPNATAAKVTGTGGGSRSGVPAVDALLGHYTRLWV
jgi:hypothetical protein